MAPEVIDPLSPGFSPIEDILEDARNGRMYILVDAEDRENEGDLIIPAQFATPDAVNFMAKHGRGLICLALTAERARELRLEMMVRDNRESMGTAFTVSIEAKDGVTTGISAHDRARTIAVAIDASKGPRDIVTPGHVFPLVARDGGVLVRTGHTEASVDISRLAGLIPSGVICEIMNDDGSMARVPDLLPFAARHGLKIGTIADLIAYRRRTERYLERVLERELDTTSGGPFRVIVYRNTLDGVEHLAFVKGRVLGDRATLVRMHRLDLFADALAEAGGRAGLIPRAMARLSEAPEGGVLVVVRDPDPRALTRRLAADDVPPQEGRERAFREYGVGAQILKDLGVRRMVLLSDSPQRLVGLDGHGLSIEGWQALNT
jgi:3,4-dihydroxy 2-butanone 4-phosphate synthase/GTP cyclohydrolase II